MKPVRVMRVIARLNVGGPAIHTVLLTSGLDRERFESTLVAGRVDAGEGDMGYIAEQRGVHPVYVDELGRSIRPTDDLVALWKLYRLMRRLRPDVVHTHTAKAGTLGRIAALAAGVPVRVHTFHGHVFAGYFSPSKTRVFLFIERMLARATSRIVAISDSQRRELSDVYRIAPAAKFAVVPLGLDLAPFAAVPDTPVADGLRAELGIGADETVVTIVGRLAPIKDHAMFLDAAERVLATAPHGTVRFVIVGGGELDEEVRARAAAFGDRVLFAGWRRDLAPVYAATDIVALTSRNEGTPVALIEALASGRPIVATDVGGVREVVGKHGILTPPRDADAFARALTSLVEDREERARLAVGARASVIVRFSDERLAGTIAELYLASLRSS